jgi:hypothetical protein
MGYQRHSVLSSENLKTELELGSGTGLQLEPEPEVATKPVAYSF